MAGCHRKWLNDCKVLLLERSGEVCYQAGVHCLKEVRGKTWFSLNLFNTKMTPGLVVNKAIGEYLIGGLFIGCLGPGSVPSGSSSIQATLKWSSSTSPLKTLLFSTLILPLSVWSVFIPSLLPPCLSLFHSSYSSCSLLSQDHFFSHLISIPKPHAFPPRFKCY